MKAWLSVTIALQQPHNGPTTAPCWLLSAHLGNVEQRVWIVSEAGSSALVVQVGLDEKLGHEAVPCPFNALPIHPEYEGKGMLHATRDPERSCPDYLALLCARLTFQSAAPTLDPNGS